MNDAPAFFVPAATPEQEEAVFVGLARIADGAAVPPIGERIYSITYSHDGEIWTSTVGETSRGIRRRTVGRGSAKREHENKLSDPAIALAIFPGEPYRVVTDHGIGGRNTGSTWANPFYVGQSSIKSLTRFKS